jgi:hypothetical protein
VSARPDSLEALLLNRRRGLVLLGYAALTLILTFPLWLRAADHQLGGGVDPWLFIWTVAWDVHALTHTPLSIFDANIFYPHPNTLAYSEHLIGTALIAGPVIQLTGNPVLATNIVALASVFLCAIGGYFLGRRLGLSPPAAFLCGLIFAFVPPRFGRIYQLHLTTIYWVPLTLGFLYTYLQQGRARDLWWATGLFSLQALTSGHGAALLILGAALMIAHRLATGERLAPGKRLRDLGVPGLVLLTPVVLMFIPYWRARREVGLVRTLDDTGVTATSWLASTSRVDTWLVSLLPDWPWLQTPPDVVLFPGVVAIALAAAGVWLARRSSVVWLFLPMLLLTVWLAIGPPFGIWAWIYWLPGLSFIRVPSRFMLLGMLALAVLAAIGFGRITARLTPRRRAAAAIATALLLAGEFASVPLDVRPHHIGPYPVDEWLATLPKPFSVVEIPVPQSSLKSLVARRHAEFMLHSIAHFQPIVQGYSGIEPPGFEEFERTLMLFPDEKSLDALAARKVTYAVVHMDYFPPELVEYAQNGLERFEAEGRLRLVHTEGAGRVYAIVR